MRWAGMEALFLVRTTQEEGRRLPGFLSCCWMGVGLCASDVLARQRDKWFLELDAFLLGQLTQFSHPIFEVKLDLDKFSGEATSAMDELQ